MLYTKKNKATSKRDGGSIIVLFGTGRILGDIAPRLEREIPAAFTERYTVRKRLSERGIT